MSLFEHVPYTNFHDLNLSWMLKFTNNVKKQLDKIDDSVKAAQDAQTGAETAEEGAQAAQIAAESARDAAAQSAQSAATSATQAATSAGQAQQNAQNAATSATQAAGSATNASGSASGASSSAAQAQQSATNAAGSATQAQTSAGNASTSAGQAQTAAAAAQAAQAAAEAAAAGIPSEASILENAFKQVLPLCFWTGGGVATVRSRASQPNINNLYEEYTGMVEMVMPAANYWTNPYDNYTDSTYGTFRVWHPCSGGLAIPVLLQQGQNTDRYIVYPAAQVGDYVDASGNMHVFGRVWDIINNTWAANDTVIGPLLWVLIPNVNSNFGSNV